MSGHRRNSISGAFCAKSRAHCSPRAGSALKRNVIALAERLIDDRELPHAIIGAQRAVARHLRHRIDAHEAEAIEPFGEYAFARRIDAHELPLVAREPMADEGLRAA